MEIIRPKLFVVSAPSGAGKTTIIHRAIDVVPELVLSVSHTSRSPREGEIDGSDYFFLNTDEFKKKIEKKEFLEWAEVHGNYYGTSIKEINKRIKKGETVILDIDVQGAQQVRKNEDIKPLYIFIEPPSMDELTNRLVNRGTETEETLQKRIKNAKHELTFKNQYDFVIVNDQLDKAVEEFVGIITNNFSD
ncbi:MAG: guanylate kinase [Proteobacteria bacterium]|nr:guanylate kinase [Pseudomonadota bacterium]